MPGPPGALTVFPSGAVYVKLHVIGASVTTEPSARLVVPFKRITSPVRSVVSGILSSSVATGFAITVYAFVALTPSASAVIVTAPALTAVTLPKRSTVATDGSEERHAGTRPDRADPSACAPVAQWANVSPV